MALTRDFKETIRARAARDPKFRKEILREGIESLLTGYIATAKTILRNYINATVGFTELAEVRRTGRGSRATASPASARGR
jgi:hypothetical protein